MKPCNCQLLRKEQVRLLPSDPEVAIKRKGLTNKVNLAKKSNRLRDDTRWMDCNTERSHDDDQSPDVVPIDEPTKTAKKKKLPMAVRKQPIQLAPQRATATNQQLHTLMYINYSEQKEHKLSQFSRLTKVNEERLHHIEVEKKFTTTMNNSTNNSVNQQDVTGK